MNGWMEKPGGLQSMGSQRVRMTEATGHPQLWHQPPLLREASPSLPLCHLSDAPPLTVQDEALLPLTVPLALLFSALPGPKISSQSKDVVSLGLSQDQAYSWVTSLAVEWQDSVLPMQGPWVRSLVRRAAHPAPGGTYTQHTHTTHCQGPSRPSGRNRGLPLRRRRLLEPGVGTGLTESHW